MTRFFTTASLIAVSFTAVQASAELVNHWTFDSADRSGNTAFDTAGAEANNAVSGSAVYAAGLLGDGAASFDTTGSSIFDITGPMELTNATGITISMWIKNEATQETDSGNSNNNNGLFQTRNATVERTTAGSFSGQFWGLNLERSGNTGDFTVRGNSTGATKATGISVLEDWTHIAFTWERNDPNAGNVNDDPTAVYINGALAQAGTVNADILLTGGDWTIGHDAGNSGRDYNGLIDDIGVFDEALALEDIAEIYNGAVNNGLNVAEVPEPGSLALLGLGGLLIARRRRG